MTALSPQKCKFSARMLADVKTTFAKEVFSLMQTSTEALSLFS
jgi:hypothetical protein